MNLIFFGFDIRGSKLFIQWQSNNTLATTVYDPGLTLFCFSNFVGNVPNMSKPIAFIQQMP